MSAGCDRRTSSAANHTPKSTSKARQKPGHQLGTPGLSITEWWMKSNTPWPIMAAGISHRFVLKPSTPSSKNPLATKISTTRVRPEPPISANST